MKKDDKEKVIDNKIEIFAMGIDFSDDFSQVSYIGTNDTEPVSLSTLKGEKRYLIPTVLYKKKQINEWCIGDEANQRFYDDDDESQTVRNIIKKIMKDEVFLIENKTYTAKEMLQIFFRELLIYAKNILGAGKIHEITVTVPKTTETLTMYIYDAVKKCGFDKEHIRVLTHSESFIYYTINQQKNVWVNDVGLFDFNNEHFIYKRLSVIKNKKPAIISVSEMDFSRIISDEMMYASESRAKADIKFYEIIIDEFRKHIASAVYLTGTGFYQDWAEKSLKELCSKRRVFKGYNLFVKGACYASYKKYRNITAVEHIFQCEGRTKCNIGLMIEHEGRNIVMLLSKAGTNWYNAGAQVECIIDNVKQMQFVFSPAISNIQRNVVVDLSSLPVRENKTTRVRISIAYKNDSECEIEVRDLGFGDFFKATDTVIRETVDINDLLL